MPTDSPSGPPGSVKVVNFVTTGSGIPIRCGASVWPTPCWRWWSSISRRWRRRIAG